MRSLYIKIFLLFLLLHPQVYSQQIIDKSPLVIGEQITLNSEILSEERELNIYLPAGYTSDSNKSYPVIYLLDGSMDEDFIHIVGLVQFGTFPWVDILAESIVVGISNVDRRRDYTFPTSITEDKEKYPTTGGSAKFISFLREELLPFVESNYRIESNNRSIIGQSLGGLLACEILFKQSSLFDKYIIVSPSLWWDNVSLLAEAPQTIDVKAIYLAIGSEGELMDAPAMYFYEKVEALASDETEIFFQHFPERSHADLLHIAVYDAFEKLGKIF